MHPDFGAPGCAAGTAVTPFSPCFCSCSHPPAVSAGKLCKTKSSTHFHTLNFFGGRGWIRTTEAESSRFTVCPHWPLGNTPIFFCVRRADCTRTACIYYHAQSSLSTICSRFYRNFCTNLSNKLAPWKNRPEINVPERFFLELVTGVEPATH